MIITAVSIPVSVKSGKSEVNISLTLWQIDGFEGGKGSRTGYLQQTASDFSKKLHCHITVTSLTAEAARENLSAGNVPDMISYAAGAYGFEKYFTGEKPYEVWCRGGYCLLTIDGDFSDATHKNTVVNSGKDNFSSIAALFCGLQGAAVAEPTSAYVSLIGGKYKYLLGTQRDIYRLKTRGESFRIKPVTEFNDLYQNISVTAKTAENRGAAEYFIQFLLSRCDGVKSLGLTYADKILHDDEMREMEGLKFDYELKTPVSEATREKLLSAVKAQNINLIKNIIK